MPRGGQWTPAVGATMQPRGKKSGAAGGKNPRGHVALKSTGPKRVYLRSGNLGSKRGPITHDHTSRPDPFTSSRHHDDMNYFAHAVGGHNPRVNYRDPIPPASRAPRPSWRRTM